MAGSLRRHTQPTRRSGAAIRRGDAARPGCGTGATHVVCVAADGCGQRVCGCPGADSVSRPIFGPLGLVGERAGPGHPTAADGLLGSRCGDVAAVEERPRSGPVSRETSLVGTDGCVGSMGSVGRPSSPGALRVRWSRSLGCGGFEYRPGNRLCHIRTATGLRGRRMLSASTACARLRARAAGGHRWGGVRFT